LFKLALIRVFLYFDTSRCPLVVVDIARKACQGQALVHCHVKTNPAASYALDDRHSISDVAFSNVVTTSYWRIWDSFCVAISLLSDSKLLNKNRIATFSGVRSSLQPYCSDLVTRVGPSCTDGAVQFPVNGPPDGWLHVRPMMRHSHAVIRRRVRRKARSICVSTYLHACRHGSVLACGFEGTMLDVVSVILTVVGASLGHYSHTTLTYLLGSCLFLARTSRHNSSNISDGRTIHTPGF
jgi:hypothetical protein